VAQVPKICDIAVCAQDYYNDLSLWLEQFYFRKLVRECLDKIILLYLYSLFSKGKKAEKEKKSYKDPLRIAQKIRNDSKVRRLSDAREKL
jgi:hypothetical protein